MTYHKKAKSHEGPDSVVHLLVFLTLILLFWIMHSMVLKIMFSK